MGSLSLALRRRNCRWEGRLDLVYNAAHAMCLAALRLHGYRPVNRYIVFQVLPHTLQLGPVVWRVLAKCHDIRNLGEYGGDLDLDERIVADLILIDYEDPRNNDYEATEEFAFHDGQYGTREDVVFLINGIPVLVIECKSASKDEVIALGVDQIRRYHRETPDLFVPEQLFTASDAIGWAVVPREEAKCVACSSLTPVYLLKERVG